MPEFRQPPSRRYPWLFERLIPLLLGVLVLAMVVLLFIAIGVVLGWIH